jgi:hypothetical protein
MVIGIMLGLGLAKNRLQPKPMDADRLCNRRLILSLNRSWPTFLLSNRRSPMCLIRRSTTPTDVFILSNWCLTWRDVGWHPLALVAVDFREVPGLLYHYLASSWWDKYSIFDCVWATYSSLHRYSLLWQGVARLVVVVVPTVLFTSRAT